jgi:myo-inositol-1(or 4)-monophosphatase
MPPSDSEACRPDALLALRVLAEQAARAGGLVARQKFGHPCTVRRKPDGSEVTDVDEAAQAAVLACLRAARPQDAVIAEEGLADGGAGAATRAPVGRPPGAPAPDAGTGFCWIIDPLDGTRNYVQRIPLYTCSVAVAYRGDPAAGALYDPERDEMYSVSQDGPVLLNGEAILPVRPGRPSDSALGRPLVGIPSSLRGPAYALVRGWGPRVIVRNLGSAALHLAMVAVGQLQAAVMSDTRVWDIAAGGLMVMAAGGLLTALDGRPVFPVDLARYAGEPIACLASHDPQTHALLLPGTAELP